MRIPFDFSISEWMEAHNFEMELIELTSSELWKAKFMELRKNLEDDSKGKSTPRGGSKIKNLGHLSKINQILYT